tara:strand:+ start:245 stop:3679 length:3435 start_codon:yes stop_codon:yes gene_type:complete
MTTIFSNLNKWLTETLKKPENIHLNGFSQEEYLFSLSERVNQSGFNEKVLIVCNSGDEAEKTYQILKCVKSSIKVFLITSELKNIYNEINVSPEATSDAWRYLSFLSQAQDIGHIAIFNIDAFLQKYPPITFFKENSFKIEVNQTIDPFEMSEYLVEIGYSQIFDCSDKGSFSKKGLIVDINPTNFDPIRITFDDDKILKIQLFDTYTQRTINTSSIGEVTIAPGLNKIIDENRVTTFKNVVQRASNFQKEKFLKRKDIFSDLNNEILFPSFEKYIPLFFSDAQHILQTLKPNYSIYFDLQQFDILKSNLVEQLRENYESSQNDKDDTCLLPEYDKFLDTIKVPEKIIDVSNNYSNDSYSKIDNSLTPSRVFINQHLTPSPEGPIKAKIEALKKIISNGTKLIFSTKNQGYIDELEFLLNSQNISTTEVILSDGFYHRTSNTLVLSENDVFGKKLNKTKATKVPIEDFDLFAEQISSLEKGDYVIHKELGLGKYLGTELMKNGNTENDFLVIEFDKGDKVYLPSYKINLIQKHSSKDVTNKLSNLRTKNFENTKKKIQDKIKTLAFDLLELNAKRKISKAFSFKEFEHEEREFGLAFPYKETPDQLNAIQMVSKNMEKTTPMDHLVCGDVGFGKTEVAIRSAHKAVLNKKQVAVLVPTTILTLQHFNSFKKRFKNEAINIEFISRFKTQKEIKDILERVSLGLIDILIGTHKLLSDKVKFKNLGLLIVDEEQRFGVAHKEKFKNLKANIDCLTLSATPIPRTLQLAFLGLKEFSVIKTPPPKRQSIKTYLMKDDDYIIKQAIEYELSRGGQVYFVHNRVRDIEEVYQRVLELVPEAKVVYAHGQMKEKELEERIISFFKGRYNVLIATTIIESGIDVPSANTLIVSNADNFGLSQLHQLRGRIGRSDKKAFAYLMVKNLYTLSSIASKRLKALQKLSEVGSGFSIASVDLELRGAGDILGAEQSGHMEEIGLELYMELLDQAIKDLNGKENSVNRNIELITDFSSKIPSTYIEEASVRLKYYKLLSNSKTLDRIDDLLEEISDRFGPPNIEVINLANILKTRLKLAQLGVVVAKKVSNSITLTFEQNYFQNNQEFLNKVIKLVSDQPKYFQLNAKGELFCQSKIELDNNNYLEFVSYIAENIKA